MEHNVISPEEFEMLVNMLPDGVGLLIDTEDDSPKVNKFTSDELEELSKRDGHFNIVGLSCRPGCSEYFQALEQAWFTPSTPLNYDFEYRLFKWQEMLYEIGSVPLEKKHLCFEMAEKMGMRLANGVPHVLGGGLTGKLTTLMDGVEAAVFPLSNPNTFTLESERGSPIYEGRSEEVKVESQRRRDEIKKQSKEPGRN